MYTRPLLEKKQTSEKGSVLKERICLQGSKVYGFRIVFFQKVANKTIMKEFISL